MSTTSPREKFPLGGLVVLASAIFVSVTSEFLPTGLLPDMAESLGVSASRIGLLVSVFAGAVVLTAAPLAALTRRFSRKRLVLVVLVVIAVANLGSSLAPSYELLLAARVLGGLAHGLFWAVVGAYAAHLVPRHQLARAVAITSSGGTIAFVLGVPVGTALGHALGWRLAFAVMAALVLLLGALVLRLLPAVDHSVPLSTGEISLPIRKDPTLPAVLVVCVIVAIVMIGHNLFYTYIAAFIIEVAAFPASAVSALLFLYGGAGAIGLLLAGFVGDRHPRTTVLLATALTSASIAGIAFFPTVSWPMITGIVIWGISLGALPALLQTRMMASASVGIRDVASAYLTVAFNLAIGGGALAGGLLLDRFGLAVLPFVAVAVTAVGALFIVATDLARARSVPPAR